MIDIHSHILPNFDDGSESISDTQKMLSIAEKNGITDIIATPHSYSVNGLFRNPTKAIVNGVSKLKEILSEKNIDVGIHAGEEILFDEDTVTGLKEGRYITLCNSRYPLIEFVPDEHFETMMYAVKSLIDNGFVPVVAHPERYYCIQRDMMNAFELKDCGALFQINSQSIFGLFGKAAAETANRLIFGFSADFIAGDSHNPYFRSSEFSEIHELISEEIDFKYAELLLKENPGKIIGNEDIFSIGGNRR